MNSDEAAIGFGALAQNTRLDVIKTLVRAGPAGMAAGKLAEAVATPPSTLSFHLKELAGAGLISSVRQGRQIIYTADFDGIRGLVAFLISDCCADDPAVTGSLITEISC